MKKRYNQSKIHKLVWHRRTMLSEMTSYKRAGQNTYYFRKQAEVAESLLDMLLAKSIYLI